MILIVVFTVANSGLAFYLRDKIFKAHLSSCTRIAENANKKNTLRSCNFRVTIDWHAARFAIKRRKTSNKIEILKSKIRTSLPLPTEKVHRFMAGISVKIFTWFSFSLWLLRTPCFGINKKRHVFTHDSRLVTTLLPRVSFSSLIEVGNVLTVAENWENKPALNK